MMLVSAVAAAALGAGALMWGARLLHKLKLPFGTAFFIVMASGVVYLGMSAVVLVTVERITGGTRDSGPMPGLMLPVGMMAMVVFAHRWGRMPLRMACTTTVCAVAISICVGFALAVSARVLVWTLRS